jgi:hypothetical protein
MIVDHADSLHERVANGRADESEASPAQVPAHLLRLRRRSGHLLGAPPVVLDPRPADEPPKVRIEAFELLTDEQNAGSRNIRSMREGVTFATKAGSNPPKRLL